MHVSSRIVKTLPRSYTNKIFLTNTSILSYHAENGERKRLTSMYNTVAVRTTKGCICRSQNSRVSLIECNDTRMLSSPSYRTLVEKYARAAMQGLHFSKKRNP